ncbi:MAG: SufD family Fe-S cluster assembly protein [Inconstantimicrobium porci]|uniref:SufB/SufD family protein n=1 Tax=Inconstantimicrobium porci TaxID=2652291 RepID=UPI002A90D44F|nr:SufD family Fe-S cluster assembly protein [Inconstantimicrobium porci]MDY5911355.1 SufD family Fe-S cluster assembly protein [Inconstantimicrobium porci]
MDSIEKKLLHEIADLDRLPVGAYNIRLNGKPAARNNSANITIVSKTDEPGIDIYIQPNTVNESVHIPVILSTNGLKDNVYNDFHIGEGCDVTIVAGCGIHNCGSVDSQHDGIHTFYIEKNSKVHYIEKHFGEGSGQGKRLMNPTTIVHLGEGATMEMETTQIAGIDDTLRVVEADLADGASLNVNERIMTTGVQHAESKLKADLKGKDSSCNIVSHAVAKEKSNQHFISMLNGRNECKGHTECDSIIMDDAVVIASPQLAAYSTDAALIHEAAIGKIAGEQLIKLMTLGLTEKEAEEQVISGFLR